MQNLVLASSSLQKKSLLNKLGLVFEVVPLEIDEKPLKGEKPEAYVRRIAMAKAQAVSKQKKGAYVIAHDMTMDFNGKIINKPADKQDALDILKKFNGKDHMVTGCVVLMKDGEALYQGAQTSVVKFKKLPLEEIKDYVGSGEGMGLAGAYAVQGDGGMLIEGIEGSYFNIVGMPLSILIRALEKNGFSVDDGVKQTVEMQEKSIKESFPR